MVKLEELQIYLRMSPALELKALRSWIFNDRQARLAEAFGLDTSA